VPPKAVAQNLWAYLGVVYVIIGATASDALDQAAVNNIRRTGYKNLSPFRRQGAASIQLERVKKISVARRMLMP
jgi:hypothetical protein